MNKLWILLGIMAAYSMYMINDSPKLPRTSVPPELRSRDDGLGHVADDAESYFKGN